MYRKLVSHRFALCTLSACALLFLTSPQTARAGGALAEGVAMDTDGDGVPDISDNCIEVANADAAGCDSDRDGYGNACDGDFNNDWASDGADLSSTHFLADFATGVQSNNAAGDPQGTDMNCDGAVDGADFSAPYFLTQFSAGRPGASGLACAGTVPCSGPFESGQGNPNGDVGNLAAANFPPVDRVFEAQDPPVPVDEDSDDPDSEELSIEQNARKPGYVRGHLLIRLESGLGSRIQEELQKGIAARDMSFPPALAELNRQYGVTQVESLLPAGRITDSALREMMLRHAERSARSPNPKGSNGLVQGIPDLRSLFVLTMASQADAFAIAREYASQESVLHAQPDLIYETHYNPNDQYYQSGDMWALTNINASTAWDTAGLTPGQGIVVAVIDTGVYMGHPDLTANIWVNVGETIDGTDTDGNGFVDDTNGWDFSYNDNNPDDAFGHGTHVAGTIAAIDNNTIGVTGLAFEASIMPIKGLNNYGSGSSTTLVDAMWYAVDNGADIINNSWGGNGDSTSMTSLMVDMAHAMGVVVVNSAGNSAAETCRYAPTAAETGISVSAVDRFDVLAPYSNFGVKIDVAAPGGIGSTPPATANPYDDVLSTSAPSPFLNTWIGFPILIGSGGNPYMPQSGTSMAAPHVSALAAMLLSQNPGWNVEALRQALRFSSDDLSFPSVDTATGHGRINADTAAALGSAARPTANVTQPANCERVEDVIAVGGYAQFPIGGWKLALSSGPALGSLGPINVSGWTSPLANSMVSVSGGLLATLNSLDHPDGPARLHLKSGNSFTGESSSDQNLIIIDNVYISDPVNNQILSGGSYSIQGKAAGNLGFINYTLGYAPGFNSAGPFSSIAPTSVFLTQVNPAGTLASNWDLSGIPTGNYTLQLTANFSSHSSTDSVNVRIDQSLMSGWPAAVNHQPTFHSPKIVDLDGDGAQEVVFGASVYQDDGNLKSGWTMDPGLGRTNPAILNVDGDSDLEVVAAVFDWVSSSPNSGAPVIYAYNPDKSVVWSHSVQNTSTSAAYNHGVPSALAAGDVDGDGQMEIVFTVWFNYNNPSPHQTDVFVLDAATGTLESTFNVTGTSIASPALADLDGDTVPEIVFGTYLSSGGVLHAVDQLGTPIPSTSFPVSVSEALGVIDPVIGDADSDGEFEILMGKRLYNHDGSIASIMSYIARSTGVMGYFPDNDCEMELVTGGGNSWMWTAFHHDGSFVFTRSDTNESTNVIMAGENGKQGNPLLADVDGDGQVDIIAPAEQTSWSTPKLYATPSFPIPPVYEPAFLSGFPREMTGAYQVVRSTSAVGDLDGNGTMDLLSAVYGQIYAWDTGVPWSPERAPWPMFGYDLRNSGTVPRFDSLETAGGNIHSIARTSAGTVIASGRNNWGQLGDGSTVDRNLPVETGGLCNVQQIAAGMHHNVALLNDGTVRTWGLNNNGQLGNGLSGGLSSFSTTVQTVGGLSDVIQVAAGGEASLALKSDGSVWAWGSNPAGFLGTPAPPHVVTAATQIPGLSDVVKLAAGEGFRMALKADGSVWTWGRGVEGQLGNGLSLNSSVPVQVQVLSNIIDIEGGGLHALAVDSAGIVYSWGDNDDGELGIGSFSIGSNTPVTVGSIGNVVQVEAGQHFSSALRADGTVFTWGQGGVGQLGTGSMASTGWPAAVGSLGDAQSISNGLFHVLTIEDGGSVAGWGHNFYGELGNGSNTSTSTPVTTDF